MKKIIATTILWLLLRGAGFLMAQNPLYQGIIYVTPTGAGTHSGNSWENATSSIDTAQALAEEHDAVVWVAAGTYYGDTTVTSENAFTMRDGVSVYGGFAGNEPADYDLSLRDFEANATILDGMNARRVLYQPFEFNSQTVWDGFTIQNGQTSGDGAGIYLLQNVLLSQCRIQNNISTNGSGGGVFVYNSTLSDCEIHSNAATSGGGVFAESGSSIKNSQIYGNSANSNDEYGGGYGGGVYADNSNIQRCQISFNNSVANGGGAFLRQGSVLLNCLISNNTSRSSGGVFLSKSYDYYYGDISIPSVIVNTTIVRNEAEFNAGIGSYGDNYMINSVVWGNEGESDINAYNLPQCYYSAIENECLGETNIPLMNISPFQPLFVNPSLIAGVSDNTDDVDWHLQQGSILINRGSTSDGFFNELYELNPVFSDMMLYADSVDLDGTLRVRHDTVDLGCYESDYFGFALPDIQYSDIIYVTPTGSGMQTGESWNNAVSSIEQANLMAGMYNASQVWVAAGVYFGDTTAVSAFRMHEGVNVYGGFEGDEPADFDLSLRDFEANATILDGQNARRVLCQPFEFDEETIWDGFEIRNGWSNDGGGGAMLQYNGTLSQCKIYNNESMYGGGVNAFVAKIISCEIFNNVAATGGGVFTEEGATVSNCKIFNNIISPSYFLDNDDEIIVAGAGVASGGYSIISNCLLSNNTAEGESSLGGGFYSYYGGDIVTNTTIVHNVSANEAGMFIENDEYGEESTLTNSILWGNKTSDGTSSNLSGNITCSYSAVEGGFEGDSIIALSAENPPLFVNPSLTVGTDDTTANVDWHLQQGSPCINAGDNSAVADSLDLDGNPRVYQSRVDMGCYEWQGSEMIPVGDGQSCTDVPTVMDYDGIMYNTVQIGNQCWMKENLRTTHYSDGTEISMGYYSLSESIPYRYCPGNNCDYVPDYGYLYNWSAVIHGMSSSNANPSMHQGVCPEGWHVPSASEWVQLLNYVKSESVYWCGNDSNYIAKALANTLGWNSYSAECAVGNSIGENNQTGFSAMPAGNFYGPYDNFNDVAFFWTSSVYQSPVFYALNSSLSFVDSRSENKAQGFSVRCLRNDTLEAAYSGIIYVTPSGAGTHSGSDWANATSSIDSAQTLAQANNAVVWVAAGTYYGDTTVTSENAFTMRDGVNVYGGFAGNEPADYDLSLRDFEANETVLDGQNARRVLYQPSDFNSETTWDGFSIQNGQTSGNGAGAYLQRNAVLSQCRVQGNVSSNGISGGGGGVYCNHARVDKCDVYGNTSLYYGGGVCATNSTVSDCRIERNAVLNHYPNPQYYGGGGIRASSSTITGCRIKGNQSAVAGGGVFSSGDVLSNCEISENTAVNRGGGINLASNNSRITDCLVCNNTATSVGGGISGSGMVVNTTIVRNTSTGEGAGVNGISSFTLTTLTNCIVWGNEQNGVSNNLEGNISCSFSAIEDGCAGTGNIALNETTPPLFVSPSLTAGASDSTANVDWHLLQGSPCINRGNNDAVMDSLDLDGTMRIKRDTVDMGCYESDYYSEPMAEYDSIIFVTVTGAGARTGESWANAVASIAEAQGLAQTYNAVVWVAAGVYYGDTAATSENAFTMRDGVNVYGGFAGNEPADYDLSLRDFEANATILDGQNVRRVLYQPDWFNTETVWNGFTIQNGWTTNNGGGAYLQQKGRLSQCRILNNSTGCSGGGVYSNNAIVENCDIAGNVAVISGGGLHASSSTVSDCRLTGNSTTATYSQSVRGGGGVMAWYSNVTHCQIVGNASNDNGGGVYAYYGTVKDCIVSNNTSATQGGGVYVYNGNVKGCLVFNNTSVSQGGGVYLSGGNRTVANTTIVRNSTTSGSAGAYITGTNTLVNCIVWGNERNGVSYNLDGSFSCSNSAVEGGCPGTENIALNETTPPLFVSPSLTAGASDSTANVDWHLLQGSPCINRGNNDAVMDSLDLDGTARIKRDTVDMGCYESDYYSVPMAEYDSIIYVTVTGAGTRTGESWANAVASIAEAQGLAQTYNAVVWVAAGTYYGDTTVISENAFTMRDGVNVYGGFAGNEPADFDLSQRDFEANATILDGMNARRVLYQPSAFDTQTTWDGFTIQNGQTSGDGAGAYLLQNGRLSQCNILNNISANGSGGGVYCSGAIVEDCDIVGNICRDHGGGVYASNSTVSDCIISNNSTTNTQGSGGGGVYLFKNNYMERCKVSGNVSNSSGGGVYTYSDWNTTSNVINRCEITQNRSRLSGGGLTIFSPAQVNNCLVANNRAEGVSTTSNGGGISGSGTVTNTTIVRNTSSSSGAGVSGVSSITLTNCIVWGNEWNGETNNIEGSFSCAYSAVEDGCPGTGNIALNETTPPLFVSPSLTAGTDDSTANVDWNLLPGSPCVNAGDNSVVTDSLDLSGTARIKRDTVDMGCYESDYNSITLTGYDSIIYVTVTGAGNQSGNSWANATSIISVAQALAITHDAVVWVAAGTYYGDTTSANAFTMRNGVNVYGGFAGDEPADYDLSLRDFEANETFLDGKNARRVLNQPSTFNVQTIWNGFTIQNGQTSGNGAGVYLQQNGRLSHCRIQNNISANGDGGGVHCTSAVLEDCDIIGNKCRNNGGGVYASNSTMFDCRILNNSTTNGNGGGVYLYRDNHLEWCKMTNNVSKASGGGVYTYSDWYTNFNEINRCEITHNRSLLYGGGIYTSSKTQVNNCLVANNSVERTSSSYGGGVSGSGTVTNTTIVCNTSTGDGAGVNGSSSTTLQNCIVWGNERNGAVNNLNGSSVVCSHSAIEGGYEGDSIVALTAINPPLFVRPSLTAGADDSTTNVDWHLQQGSPCINAGDNSIVTDSLDLDGTARIKRDTVDLGCYESDYYSVPMTDVGNIVYVTQTGAGNQSGGSWANATSSLSDAQALAIANNAVVWVAAGTYYGDTTSSNAFTMRDGVNVYGGFAGNEPADFDLSQRDFETNATILDGRNERRVLNQPYEFNKETEWDGFTIQNGRISGDGAGANLQRNSKLSQCKVQNNYSTNGNGGGICCRNASVESCDIVNNSCRKKGGGGYVLSSTVSDCRIENNTATNGGGGISVDASVVANCRIVSNQSAGDGGGAWSYNTRFTHCDIIGNISNLSGGGVYSYFSAFIFMNVAPTIVSQCRISNNYAGSSSGGIRMGYYSDEVLNSLVCNNTSGSGTGGMTGSGNIVNTTIVRNLSGGNSAGVTGDVNLKNCIVWGNKNSTGAANNIVGKEIVCSYSAVEGGFIGEGNFTLAEENSSADNSPYFVNPTIGTGEAYDNGDWHLLPQSVCLNMGSLDTTILSDIDLDGQPRLQQNRVDMGCYEYQAATDGTLNISVVSGDIMRGGAAGDGYYNPGDTVRLLAIPNLYARFLRWSDNDTTNPRVVIASVDTTFTAFFELDLPELHVTSISHSELIGGDSATITWTVRNDGTVPTPSGAVWYDRVWLSPEPKVDVEIESGSLVLLGTLPNMSALNPGDSYTQTMEVNIPLQISGDYYLFVITDAYDADQIFWEDGVEIPYNPPTYYGALSHNCYGSNCVNDAGNKILEISEYDNNPRYPYYHDNFFYDFSEVHIPQFPDLKVTSVFPITQNFFSGTAVNLTYQVTNDGDYVTWRSDWRDVIFVSNSPEFDSDAEILQIVPHHGLLLPDSSYQVSTDVTVPLDLYGTAYFYVHTDYYDQIYEHINNYNNITRSDSVNVFLTLPADLAPQNITADNVVSTGATFNFSYEIHNQGAGAPNHNTWEDKCYLSTNADFLENTVLIARDQHFNGLAAGESYAVQHSITLPNHLTTGTYYLFVNADAENNVFEYTSEENNLARFVQPISVVQPDLQIVSLNVDDTLHAGAEVACIYQLANAGAGAVINRTMTDYLYLTQAPDGTAATQIGELSYNLWLNAQDTTLRMKNVQLPDNLQSGVYFLFVKTNEPRVVNGPRSVNESDYNNNMSPIKRVYIHYQPLPDLVVTDIELPDIVTAGDSVAMRIHLHNQGEVPANIGNLGWRLFATKGSHQYDCVVGSGDADTTVLPPGGSVYLLKNVFISPIVFGSPASFTLAVNPNHALTESIYSNNSHTFSHLVQPYPFDLAADQLSTLNETISGEYIPVTWTVENAGTMPMESQPMYMRQDTTYAHSLGTLQIPWYDRIYLSTDSLFDADDEEIGTYTRNQALNAGDSYTANLSCLIPVAADGDYYVLVVSDATNVTFDYRRANNVCGQPISITQSTLPDLQMDTLSTISTLTTGDSYQVRYTVSNVGEHVTHDDRWTEAIYLNNQPTLVDAVLLGSKTHYGLLDVSEWYSDSLSVTIPNTWIGNCYLIGVTDATGQIVESNDETNNMFVLSVSITRPLPCDLTVIPPDIPESAMVGEDIQISWTLQNIGLNTAQGNIKDAVYLSIDNTWSSDDIMLGSETFAVNLAANGQQQRNATLFLQGVPIGDYYVVVRTNILNALNENSYDNNNSVSLLKIHLDYPSLYIGQEEHSQLNSGQSIYYKLEVGPEYEHQTLSCKLTAPSPYVSNDLYIAYSSAPSASNFDWSATRPYVQAQEILIPSLNQGVYYIMAHGQTADDASQAVTLLASIINFEIISVNVNSGANAGSVTTQITGAKFDTIMDFRLANSNAYLPAEKVFFHNSTEAYATFNLRGQEPGVYDMEAELPGGIITVKGQAFVVEPGLPSELQAHIIAPAGVPVGTTFTVTIEYGNNGSTDLDVSGFLVVSTNGFPIALCSDSLVNNTMELTLETAEANGNPDVIRPGHFATKTIFVKANRVGNIELKLYPIRRQY